MTCRLWWSTSSCSTRWNESRTSSRILQLALRHSSRITRREAQPGDGGGHIDAALDRAEQYLEAGADILFVEALPDVAAMQTALARFRGRAPLLANMVEGGKSPLLPAAELQQLGFALAIFPGAMVRVQTFAAQRYLETLKRDGTTSALLGEMLHFEALNQLLGTEAWLERGKRYE